MTHQDMPRSLSRMLPLLVISFALPHAALSQPVAPGPAELAPDARTRFTRATEDGAWNQLVTQPGTSPEARFAHSAVYDSLRDRVLVFGGEGNGDLNDVWALSLNDTTWTQLTPTGTLPGVRMGHSAIYDPLRDRVLIFGGEGSSNSLNDVWSLSLAGTPAWTQLTPSGILPSVRQGHRAIYDPVRDEMVVFGGYDETMFLAGYYSDGMLNDVWSLSLAVTPTWTQVAPTGTPPSPRYLYGGIYDPERDRMVIFGGGYWDNSNLSSDVWVLSLGGTPAWTQLSPMGTSPAPRLAQSAIYDPVRDRMVVFGGWGSVDMLNEVWSLSLAETPAWTPLAPAGILPSARCAHSAIYDPPRDRMVVFGGVDGSGSYNDVWELGWMTPTPVAMIQVEASVQAGTAILAWTTAALPAAFRIEMRNEVGTWDVRGEGEASLFATGDTYEFRDAIEPGRHVYRLFGYGSDGEVLFQSGQVEVTVLPFRLGFLGVAPNPFHGQTALRFEAPTGVVRLEILDLSGRRVRTLNHGPVRGGVTDALWDGRDDSGHPVASGVYLAHLRGIGGTRTEKLVLLR